MSIASLLVRIGHRSIEKKVHKLKIVTDLEFIKIVQDCRSKLKSTGCYGYEDVARHITPNWKHIRNEVFSLTNLVFEAEKAGMYAS